MATEMSERINLSGAQWELYKLARMLVALCWRRLSASDTWSSCQVLLKENTEYDQDGQEYQCDNYSYGRAATF